MAMTSPFYFPGVSISSCAVCCFVEACIMPPTSVVVLFLFDKVPYKTSQPVIYDHKSSHKPHNDAPGNCSQHTGGEGPRDDV